MLSKLFLALFSPPKKPLSLGDQFLSLFIAIMILAALA